MLNKPILYPNRIEAKSACGRSSNLSCEARPDKRQGAVHQYDPKAAGLSLGMATREILVRRAYKYNHSNTGDMGGSHQVAKMPYCLCEKGFVPVPNWQRLQGCKPRGWWRRYQEYRTGVEREPNPKHKVQMCERGITDHPPFRAGPAAVEVVVRSRSRHSSHREGRKDWQQSTDDTVMGHGKTMHRAKGDSWIRKTLVSQEAL